MNYLILIYTKAPTFGHPAFLHAEEVLAMSEDERAAMVRDSEALFAEISASGELVSGAALADPSLTRTFQTRGNVPAVTDGPFAETKEQMAGVLIVNCATAERAEEIASRIPESRVCAVELRPIVDMGSARK